MQRPQGTDKKPPAILLAGGFRLAGWLKLVDRVVSEILVGLCERRKLPLVVDVGVIKV